MPHATGAPHAPYHRGTAAVVIRTHDATREAACADLFDHIERFCNPIRRHLTLNNKSPINFERPAAAKLTVHATRHSPDPLDPTRVVDH